MTVPIYETVRVHKNGKHTELEILLSPVRNTAGEVIGVSTIARDITARKMNEQRRDEFISVASHELKTPVTSIKAYTEVLLDQLESSGDDASASLTRKLDKQVDKLIDLIRTLLDTTTLAAGELLLHPEAFDLNTLIGDQISTISLVSDRHQFIFRAGEIKPIVADRKLIGQVLTNMIMNASKYSPDGGEIIITSTGNETGIEVHVQDFGIGIPAEFRDKIFERYFRVNNAQVINTPGIGLGLYISSDVVRQHGGTMSVVSEEGRGATFSFTLPYDMPAAGVTS